MSLLLKIGSFFIILISMIAAFRSYKGCDALKNGKLITVTVFSVPISCENATKYNKAYFEFYIGNKIFSKRFNGHCDLKPRDEIKLISNLDNTIFLFEDEKPIYEFISAVLLFLIGMLCLFFPKNFIRKILFRINFYSYKFF